MLPTSLSTSLGLAFPGGGIFFWWQAGAITGLSKRVDLSKARCAGASAGALAATLAANEVDMQLAYDRALALTIDAGAFNRGPWGLYGIWGGIIERWLDELLPSDADKRCSGRVNLLVNKPLVPVPLILPLGVGLNRPVMDQRSVSDFIDRSDLIAATRASVHVPLFLDGNLAARFRGEDFIDGSFFVGSGKQVRLEVPNADPTYQTLRLSPLKDPRMRKAYGSGWRDFLRLGDEASIREMMVWGEQYVDELEIETQYLK